jgi:hypothetical protein
MTTQITKENTESTIQKLKDAIQAGIDSWVNAGQCLVELLDHHGMSIQDIVREINSQVVNENVLSQFERIGRGQVIPSLLVSSFPAAKAIQKLPMSEQKRCMEKGVEVVIIRNGNADILNVMPDALEKDQVSQVFTKTGLRSAAAQRLYIEELASEKEATEKVRKLPWIIKGNKIYFREGCELSRHDVTMLLTQLA